MARPQRPVSGKPKEGAITVKEGNRFIYRNGKWYREGKGEFGSGQNTKDADKALAELRAEKKPAESQNKSGRTTPAARPAGTQPSSSGARTTPAARPPASNAGMKNQDKSYKGSYLKNFKEDTARMSAASLSRQQGRSNLTSEDLKRGQQQAKASATGAKAMKATGTAQNFQGGGYDAKTKPGKDYSKSSTTNQTSTAYGSKSLVGKDDKETTMKPTKMATGNKVGNGDTPQNGSKAKTLKERMDDYKKRNQRTARYGGY